MISDASLQALESWARARYGLFWPLRAQVLKLIKSYQGRPGAPRPFVGRAALLEQLDQWLLGQERLSLLTGAAGRGKSALLLHWLDRLIQRDTATAIFYLPISIRFNTADQKTGVPLLFAALCDVFSDLKKHLPQQPEIQDYINGISAAWEQMALRPEQAFLLVVDGLDEAINQWFLDRHLLPRELPSNLHVLIAARQQPGDANPAAWLRGIEGDAKPGPGGRVLQVGTLEQEAMTEAMIQLGAPVSLLAEPQALVESLYRLTDWGDPLLLTLWLGQIWRKRDDLPDLDPAALARLQPGLGELYKLWMTDQRSIWEARGSGTGPEDFQQLMHVLALAQAPMPLKDLVEVLGCLGCPWQQEKLRDILETAHRLVVGDATGYVLVHPRLAEHLQQELDLEPQRRDAVLGAFRTWGASTVLRLNSGALQPDECPAYLLNHYVAVHINAGEEPDPQALRDYYLPLLCPGWARAWHAHEGAWHGYLTDLQQVARRLQAFHQAGLRAGHPPDLGLSVQLRCALLAASIRSLMGSLSWDLLVCLAREDVWSLARAARVARQYEPSSQARCLKELAAVAAKNGKEAEAAALLQEAVQAAATIEQAPERVETLCGLADALEGDAGRAVLQQAMQAAVAIGPGWPRANALIAVAARLPGEARQTVLRQAFQATGAIQDDWSRASTLGYLAARMEGDARGAALKQALEAIGRIQNEDQRASTLSALASQLHGQNALWDQTLAAAAALQNQGHRAKALSALAAQLQGEARRALLQQAMEAAAAVPDEARRATALQAVAGQSQGDGTLLRQVLKAATAIHDEPWRAFALKAVAAQSSSNAALLQEVLEAAASIQSEGSRAGVLAIVGIYLQGELRQTVLQQALALSEAGASDRARTLSALAGGLRGEPRRALLQRALEAVALIRGESDRPEALLEVAAQLRGERALLQQALEVAAIQKESARPHALWAVVEQLEADSPLLQRALEVAATIQNRRLRADTLRMLATHLQGEARRTALRQALEGSTAIDDAWSRSEALCAVAAQLQGQARERVLLQALEAAAKVQTAWQRADALTLVAAQLQGDPGARCCSRLWSSPPLATKASVRTRCAPWHGS